MPVADVAATLQANGVEAVTEQKPGGGGMCSYLHVPKPGDYKVKLLIDFTRAGSADKAKEGFQMRRKDFEQRGMRPIDAGGLGDEAFVTEGQGDTEGLKVRSGAWIGQINLTVDGRAPATLRPAVLALGKQVLQRLPR